MRRREILTLFGGALLPWPIAAIAQTLERISVIGVLIALAESDPEVPRRVAAFEGGLRELGWIAGRNVKIHYRFAGDTDRIQTLARELIALRPGVVVASSAIVVSALRREDRTIPIVFVTASDPVGAGFVGSLARPADNVTGFTNNFWSMGGKWLELLKQIAPRVTRVGIIFNPDTATGSGSYFLPSFEAAAKSNAVTPFAIPVRTRTGIEHGLAAFGRETASGLIVMPDNFTAMHRSLVIAQSARQQMPAIYPFRYFAAEGGLISYGADLLDQYKRTPFYVDRILRGAKVVDLPVQAPAKFELVINLKAAKALGLTVPRIMLARADEVIE
jgi:putative tryptophan/tyrosine transport system substrate-binding protein